MILTWKQALCCAFVVLIGSSSLHAQIAKSRVDQVVAQSKAALPLDVRNDSFKQSHLPSPKTIGSEACLPWFFSEVRATVSVVRLGVPDKARNEYNKACGDLKKKDLPDAEQHVRSAIEKYSNYVEAWVMLGQVLESQRQPEQAHAACSQAEKIDPSYLPPYICLAELGTQSKQWDEILDVTQTALQINPLGDVYTYFYRSTALLNLNQLPEAERFALKAEGIDSSHHQAPVHYLLAQIYEAKKDIASAAAEVKQFLKLNTDQQKDDEARQYLANLEGQDSSKQSDAK
jgi:tetratricopeptide (TPR) repeat protein